MIDECNVSTLHFYQPCSRCNAHYFSVSFPQTSEYLSVACVITCMSSKLAMFCSYCSACTDPAALPAQWLNPLLLSLLYTLFIVEIKTCIMPNIK